jgi:hypothetical protein
VLLNPFTGRLVLAWAAALQMAGVVPVAGRVTADVVDAVVAAQRLVAAGAVDPFGAAGFTVRQQGTRHFDTAGHGVSAFPNAVIRSCVSPKTVHAVCWYPS